MNLMTVFLQAPAAAPGPASSAHTSADIVVPQVPYLHSSRKLLFCIIP